MLRKGSIRAIPLDVLSGGFGPNSGPCRSRGVVCRGGSAPTGRTYRLGSALAAGREAKMQDDRLFNEAVFRLGQLGAAKDLTNAKLLRRISRIVARYTDAEAVGLAGHEEGTDEPAATAHAEGPWPEASIDEAMSLADWSAPVDADGMDDDADRDADTDSDLVSPLTALRRNQVTHLKDDASLRAACEASVSWRERQQPLGVTDMSIGVYRRPDGCECVLAVASISPNGCLSDAQRRRFETIAPFAAKAWAAGWAQEPEWTRELKPKCRAVLELALAGYDDDQIAETTGLTYHAVRAHLKRLFRIAGVRSRLHLMRAYREACSGRIDRAAQAEALKAGNPIPNSAAQSNGSAAGDAAADDDVIRTIDPMDTAFGVQFSAAS
jgi:DNA-binding CsgD family transcriptional regulator